MQLLSRYAACVARRCCTAALFLLFVAPAWAQGAAKGADGGAVGAPRPWEIWMQPGYSPVKRDIIWLNNVIVTPIVVFIVVLVAALLVWVLWRYNEKRNPTPSRLTHNPPLEIAWTVIPALILIAMAIPSFRLVFFENKTNDPYMTIDVTGHQWYWEYRYPDQGNFDFMSNLIPADQLKPGQLRLLSVNHPLVLPVGENIRILESSGDVIHSFFIPSLGVQRYAIPGQTIETWVRIDQPGTFYGECNQICGLGHHEMPIEVQGVPLKQFLAWAKLTKQDLAKNGSVPPISAVAEVGGPRTEALTRIAEVTHHPSSISGKGD